MVENALLIEPNVRALARGERRNGWRVRVTESMADRAAPAVVQPHLVRLVSGRAIHV